MVQHLSQAEKGELDHYGTVFSWCMQLLVLLLLHNIILSVFEITLVRLSETSDYLPGQVNNPLAVIRQPSEKLQPDLICHII